MAKPTSSRLPGLHKLDRAARLDAVAKAADLEGRHLEQLRAASQHDGDMADHLAENVVSTLSVPIGIATNLVVDGGDVLVPMATEESSVVAAVCNGARTCRASGGVTTTADAPRMIAQIELRACPDLDAATAAIAAERQNLIAAANACDPMLVSLGGGCVAIETRQVPPLLVVHLIVDVRDAMGANAVNTMAERLAPRLAEIAKATPGLRILSNLADRRRVQATATWTAEEIGSETVDAIVAAAAFAAADPYRAATHNKGIMNGVSAVALVTGNDTRALEAGAHAFAAQGGYGPLTAYRKTPAGDLEGTLDMPMAVGIVGGATRAHPTAQAALAILGNPSTDRLARVIAAVGLVQNFSALRALATEGIQRGHMSLHARNVAIAAGATGDLVDRIAADLVARGEVREDVARRLLAETIDPQV